MAKGVRGVSKVGFQSQNAASFLGADVILANCRIDEICRYTVYRCNIKLRMEHCSFQMF